MQEEDRASYWKKVACDRIIHFRSSEKDPETGETLSKEHPKKEGYLNINVCSNSRQWKALSPMLLGPVRWVERRCKLYDYPDGLLPGCQKIDSKLMYLEALVLENIWQASKVYNIDLDKEGYIQKSFFERRARFLQETKGHRRVLPKSKGYPVSAYFDGRLFNYLESRAIYCHLYEKLVSETSEFKSLQELLTSGKKLLILGFDGQKMQATPENLEQAYANPERPFGHELVICSLLTGYRPWALEVESYAWLDRPIPKKLPSANKSGTTRVRIRRKGDKIVQDCDIYIGRRWNMGGWNLEPSPFANPYRVKDYPNQDVVALYREYLLNKPKLLKLLPSLRGKRLGCFCELTEPCHGNVLIELLEQLEN